MGVFSVIKYDPKNEAEFRRRQKLEALGGGGAQFIFPSRDWRGVSYRMLLPRKERKNKTFNHLLAKRRRGAMEKYQQRTGRGLKDGDGYNGGDPYLSTSEDELQSSRQMMKYADHSEDEISSFENDLLNRDQDRSLEEYSDVPVSSSSSDESTTYEPGFIDDPNMVQGKHRTAMVGDKVTGCVASSIIHYVRPADLKADLNKQFRQRFDQWEPPKVSCSIAIQITIANTCEGDCQISIFVFGA